MLAEDIWVRYTDKSGQSFVSYHRVWDKARFIQSKIEEAKKSGGTAEQCTRPTK